MKLGLVLLAALAGCGTDEPVPPVVVGPEQGLSGRPLPVHADADNLYVSLGTDTGVSGIYRVSLVDPSQPELLVAGTVAHLRVADDALVVLFEHGRLATIPFDGSAITEVAVSPDTRATAAIAGVTYALEYNQARAIATRIVTVGEPSRVVLETAQRYGDSNQLVADDTYLYWAAANHYRIAADGSEPDVTFMWLPADWDAFEVDGDYSRSDNWMLGAIDHEPFALENVTSFFETGEWSNGDPKGYEGFGGGALYTVAATDSPEITVAEDARLVRGDVRVAAVAGGEVLAQLRNHDLVTIDPHTGTSTRLGHTPHDLTGFTSLARNATTIFYQASDGTSTVIFGVDLEPL